MAKALGLIGNFKGKLGNTVGYCLKDSNNKQTQGVRVYQPVVRNPKTAAQAEQRCKLAPINATYRALKMVIDRGQEGKAYGNKSRLAWLKDALKAFNGGWFEKGATITAPALVPLTKGSLGAITDFSSSEEYFLIQIEGVTTEGTNTLGKLSEALIGHYPFLKEGDQVTFLMMQGGGDLSSVLLNSIVLDTTSTAAIPSYIKAQAGALTIYYDEAEGVAGAIIASREGDNGAHLRSVSSLKKLNGYDDTILAPAAKQAAIESYMSQGANTDWAEESLM